MLKKILSIVAIVSFATQLYASDPIAEESKFYKSPTKYALEKNLVKDYKVDNSFDTDDSDALQKAIDQIAKKGGGLITIPKGDYTFLEINLKSNVHIEIEAGATIRPPKDAGRVGDRYKSFVIFNLNSGVKEPIENVSIVGKGGKFTIDLREMNGSMVRCIWLACVKNFKIENIIVEDKETKYSAVVFGAEKFDNTIYGAENGVVKNIDNLNSEYGYGLLQMQYGQNILFKDLYSKGGLTVRLESHIHIFYHTSCKNYINGIVARNITCEDGHAAVMLSPHYIQNGWVDSRYIHAINSEFSVIVSDGFANKEEKKLGFKGGYFSSKSKFRDISAVYTKPTAQIHTKHFKYMPEERQNTLPSVEGFKSTVGTALGVFCHKGGYKVDVETKDIVKYDGFLPSQRIVTHDSDEPQQYYE